MKIGYARVSTHEQTTSMQKHALKQAGCEKIFTDTASGARTDRPGLDNAFNHLRAGDILVVWKLDRLGRSLQHLIETVKSLQEKMRGLLTQLNEAIPGNSKVKILDKHNGHIKLSPFDAQDEPIYQLCIRRFKNDGRRSVCLIY
jgi:Resolvase, N terminal domain